MKKKDLTKLTSLTLALATTLTLTACGGGGGSDAGSGSSAIQLTCPELEEYSGSLGWIDVCKGWQDAQT